MISTNFRDFIFFATKFKRNIQEEKHAMLDIDILRWFYCQVLFLLWNIMFIQNEYWLITGKLLSITLPSVIQVLMLLEVWEYLLHTVEF